MSENGVAVGNGQANGMPDVVLDVRGLDASYGATLIVRGVSMQVRAGELVTIIGPNGSGKSTVIKSIFGLTQIEGGSISLNGQDTTGLDTDRLVQLGIGYVPQAANVFPTLTVRENIEMGAYSMSGNIGERVNEMRGLFPVLEERWGSKAGHLSGGQRQMLALARALVTDPKMLLLDEPTAGLAPQIVDQVLAQVGEINQRGVSILLVEQNAVKALERSDRAYVLARGRNYFEDTADALLSNPDIGKVFLGLSNTSGTGADELEDYSASDGDDADDGRQSAIGGTERR